MLPQSARSIEDAAFSAFEQNAPRKAEQLSESIAKLTSNPGDLKERESLRRRLYALSASAKVLQMDQLTLRLEQAIRVVDASLHRGRALSDQELMLFAEVAAELPGLTRRSRASTESKRRAGNDEEQDFQDSTAIRLRVNSGISARIDFDQPAPRALEVRRSNESSLPAAGSAPLRESQFPGASYIQAIPGDHDDVRVAEARVIELRHDSFPPIDPATAETARDLEVEPDAGPSHDAAVDDSLPRAFERHASPPPAANEASVVVWANEAPSMARIASWLADAVSASSHAESWTDLMDYVRRDRPEIIVVDGSTVADPIMFQERLRIEANYAPQVLWLGGRLDSTEAEGHADELAAAHAGADAAWAVEELDLSSIIERSRRDTTPMSLAEELEPAPAQADAAATAIVTPAVLALPRLNLEPPDTAELRALQSQLNGAQTRQLIVRMSALGLWTLVGYAGWKWFGVQLARYLATLLA